MFNLKPEPVTSDPGVELQLRAELADLRERMRQVDHRLGCVESLLMLVHGPDILKPRPAPAPEPEQQPRLRPVGVIPGGGTIVLGQSR